MQKLVANHKLIIPCTRAVDDVHDSAGQAGLVGELALHAEQLSEESESSSEQESQGTGDSSGDPSTTSVLHPAAEVRVLVANGTDVTGAAGATLDTLVASEGYNGVQAVNDLSDLILEMTYVYYSQGYELDARKVQMIINADSDYVLPMPAELPIEDLLDANVLVHVGADLFPGG